MKQIKGDLLWLALLGIWLIVLINPATRQQFMTVTEAHPYMGGFFKFAILATMGDMLGTRILTGSWKKPKGFIWKALVWGLLGMMITLVFTVFTGGAAAAQAVGKLPFEGNKLALAFFGSAIMNLTFGPMMYVYHRFGDLYVEHVIDSGQFKVKASELAEKIDWQTMVTFSWLTTCIWVWIPCHTVVFLLPPQYRVLASAFLSILLGILIAMSKKSKKV